MENGHSGFSGRYLLNQNRRIPFSVAVKIAAEVVRVQAVQDRIPAIQVLRLKIRSYPLWNPADRIFDQMSATPLRVGQCERQENEDEQETVSHEKSFCECLTMVYLIPSADTIHKLKPG